MNKIIKTHHTPFWNPLETFSSWIRSIRAKVEKQLPHINTLWVFSLCLNLRTLQRPTRASSLTQREFILPVLHSAAWRTTTSQHVYYIVSLFHVQIPPRRFGTHACVHLKWRKVGSRKMIMSAYFCFGLRKPYRCDCFVFQNISVTLVLSIPMPFQFEELYSVSSHQKHIEFFARFRFY